MNVAHFYKVLFMCGALAAVITIMGRLNQSPGSMNVAKRARTAKLVEGINVCTTRITRLEGSGWSVFEDGLSWYRQRSSQREKVDSVAVEKWFSQHCTLLGQPVLSAVPNPRGGVRNALKIYFVNGQPQILSQSAEGYFGWMGRWFKSSQANQAIEELGLLPPAGD